MIEDSWQFLDRAFVALNKPRKESTMPTPDPLLLEDSDVNVNITYGFRASFENIDPRPHPDLPTGEIILQRFLKQNEDWIPAPPTHDEYFEFILVARLTSSFQIS